MSAYDIRKAVIPFTLSSLSFSLINTDNDAYGFFGFSFLASSVAVGPLATTN